MGERTTYAPGTFCWVDLATTDQAAAKEFYGALLGWEAEDYPAGEGMVYSMQRVGGRDVAAIAAQPPQQRDAGVPPVWNSYVSVESADAAAERATELGANVHAPPFDVMDAGRMAVIQDPQGAFFMVWEAKQMIGAALVNATGALVWNELAAPDLEAAQRFYGDLFGWDAEKMDGEGPLTYFVIRNGDRSNGGIREPRPGEPPNWLPYFGVEDAGAALARVEELGGSRVAGPIGIGQGRIGVAQDPQGAFFALWEGPLDD